MAIVQPKRMTAAEFEARYANTDRRAELIRGEVIEMSPTTPPHGIYTIRVTLPIGQFVEEHELGEVFGAETGFTIQHPDGTETVLAPDIAFIAKERLPDDLPDTFWRIPPDLVVEIRSESESRSDMQKKIALWLEGGARLVWYVDPFRQQVGVHRADGTSQTLGVSDTLSGEEVLPGFELPVRRIFRPVKTFNR
ncbi:MAG: Uma2 family endonuclease [Fimbriimonadales bacterium]|nr:Uma2 family endonuclease [Fimbriimonadales bacterium]